ncbi:MAG TPA: hypothetical protein VE974_14955 [Thermoanaerobaculia bacterium]|nr:hypothetical protein [Thermoanaerobaculia bacterium]
MLKRSLGVVLLLIAATVPLLAETVKGRSETPDGEFTWEIVLTPTAQEGVYNCKIEVTKTSTNELVFAPSITFEAGKPVTANTTGEYTGKVTVNADPATGTAMIDLELRKGAVDLVGARTQLALK